VNFSSSEFHFLMDGRVKPGHDVLGGAPAMAHDDWALGN
jgi:hypothetical protein